MSVIERGGRRGGRRGGSKKDVLACAWHRLRSAAYLSAGAWTGALADWDRNRSNDLCGTARTPKWGRVVCQLDKATPQATEVALLKPCCGWAGRGGKSIQAAKRYVDVGG